MRVTTTTSAKVDWALYANDSLFTLLTKEFKSCVRTDKTYNESELFPGITKPTVLDALTNTILGSDKSVFDVYADDDTIKSVLDHIQIGQSAGEKPPAGKGSLNTVQDVTQSVDCTTYMTPETQYYFLAAARNTQGSEYSFKAVGNVHLPDTEPPQFLSK